MELPNKISTYISTNRQSLLDGYLRFFDKSLQSKFALLAEQYSKWQGGIPFAITAFGDLLVWDGHYIFKYSFVDEKVDVILSGDTFFFENLKDKDYQNEFFDLPLYYEAVKKYGSLEADESFVFEPLPYLGGSKDIEHIGKGKSFEYLSLIIG